MANWKKSNKLISSGSLKLSMALGLLAVIPASSALADDLTVTGDTGVTYLRAQTSSSENINLKVLLSSDSESRPSNVQVNLTPTLGVGSAAVASVDNVSNGVVLTNVSAGSYKITTSDSSVQIRSVDLASATSSAKLDSDDSSVSAYAVGAAGVLTGGVVAALSSSDAFSSSNDGSSANAARAGEGLADSATSVESSVPQVAAAAPGFDPNRPDITIVKPPVALPSPNPAPGAPLVSGGGGNQEAPSNTSAGKPTVVPAPPVTNPMTPS